MSWMNDTGLPRLIQLQEAAYPGSKAYPDKRTRPALPYWTNEAQITSIARTSADERRFNYTVTMWLHLETYQAGYDGVVAGKLQDAIENVVLFFERRPGLQVNPPDAWLNNVGFGGAQVGSATIVPLGDDANRQIGLAIPLSVPILLTIR